MTTCSGSSVPSSACRRSPRGRASRAAPTERPHGRSGLPHPRRRAAPAGWRARTPSRSSSQPPEAVWTSAAEDPDRPDAMRGTPAARASRGRATSPAATEDRHGWPGKGHTVTRVPRHSASPRPRATTGTPQGRQLSKRTVGAKSETTGVPTAAARDKQAGVGRHDGGRGAEDTGELGERRPPAEVDELAVACYAVAAASHNSTRLAVAHMISTTMTRPTTKRCSAPCPTSRIRFVSRSPANRTDGVRRHAGRGLLHQRDRRGLRQGHRGLRASTAQAATRPSIDTLPVIMARSRPPRSAV